MNVEQWIKDNLPKGKTTLSVDAVEILIKLACEEAKMSERRKHPKQPEIIGPYEIDCLA
jgi:hypothetical protein